MRPKDETGDCCKGLTRVLCIVRMHQGKAVRKHGRQWQTPFVAIACPEILRPFVQVSDQWQVRVEGCRTWFTALEVEPINFRFFMLLRSMNE